MAISFSVIHFFKKCKHSWYMLITSWIFHSFESGLHLGGLYDKILAFKPEPDTIIVWQCRVLNVDQWEHPHIVAGFKNWNSAFGKEQHLFYKDDNGYILLISRMSPNQLYRLCIPEKFVYIVPKDVHMYKNMQPLLNGYMICAIFVH